MQSRYNIVAMKPAYESLFEPAVERLARLCAFEHSGHHSEFLSAPLSHIALKPDLGARFTRRIVERFESITRIPEFGFGAFPNDYAVAARELGAFLPRFVPLGFADVAEFDEAMQSEYLLQRALAGTFDPIVQAFYDSALPETRALLASGSEDVFTRLRELAACAGLLNRRSFTAQQIANPASVRERLIYDARHNLRYLYFERRLERLKSQPAASKADIQKAEEEFNRVAAISYLHDAARRTFASRYPGETKAFVFLTGNDSEFYLAFFSALRIARTLAEIPDERVTTGGISYSSDPATGYSVYLLRAGTDSLRVANPSPLRSGEALLAAAGIQSSNAVRIQTRTFTPASEEALRFAADAAAQRVDALIADLNNELIASRKQRITLIEAELPTGDFGEALAESLRAAVVFREVEVSVTFLSSLTRADEPSTNSSLPLSESELKRYLERYTRKSASAYL